MKQKVLSSNIETQKKMQTTLDDLTKREANNRTVKELRERQKQLQTNIDEQTKREEANNRTVQELREKQKQLQTSVNELTKIVDQDLVSTCKVEAVATIRSSM